MLSATHSAGTSCRRWGAWASRLRCLWTVQRWVGTSPPEGGQCLLQPGSAIDNQELRLAQPALDEIVENGAPRLAGLAAHVLCGQQHFLVVLAHHHRWFVLDKSAQVIRYRSGAGGTGSERTISYSGYLERCVRLFVQTMTLLRLELMISNDTGDQG